MSSSKLCVRGHGSRAGARRSRDVSHLPAVTRHGRWRHGARLSARAQAARNGLARVMTSCRCGILCYLPGKVGLRLPASAGAGAGASAARAWRGHRELREVRNRCGRTLEPAARTSADRKQKADRLATDIRSMTPCGCWPIGGVCEHIIKSVCKRTLHKESQRTSCASIDQQSSTQYTLRYTLQYPLVELAFMVGVASGNNSVTVGMRHQGRETLERYPQAKL
eukprot:199279-Chlamydomonas_euryale.AAC.6